MTDTNSSAGSSAPVLAGIHHLKLPVTDLARSLEWYRSRLGYQVQVEFVEQGTLMGCGLAHPAGGPDLGLRLDPGRARAAAGFDYFAIGVPDKAAMEALARKLDGLGQPHAGVHRASLGWILPEVLDPDGQDGPVRRGLVPEPPQIRLGERPFPGKALAPDGPAPLAAPLRLGRFRQRQRQRGDVVETRHHRSVLP